MIGALYAISMLIVLFIFKSDNKSREELRNKCKELYNQNIDLQLENDNLKINPFYAHSKFLGFSLEELKELKYFCDRHRFVIHDIIKSMDTNEERANDAEKIVLKVAKNKYAPKKDIAAYIKKWGVK